MNKKMKPKLQQRRLSKYIRQTTNALRVSFRKNMSGVLWGFLFSTTIAIALWLFAYFGYIDLGLPQRYDFEKLDHIVRNEIPNNYDYTVRQIFFRNNATESLIITARNRDYTNINKHDTDSDILLILDKTDKTYGLTYKFQPSVEDGIDGLGIHAMNISTSDLSGDERQDIVVGWSYVGADYSPPYVTVFISNPDSTVRLLSPPHLSNYNYPTTYHMTTFTNVFDKEQSTKVDQAYGYYTKQGSLLISNRNDDACQACSEDQMYNLNSFSIFGGHLVETGLPITNIKGFTALEKYLKENDYKSN